MAGVGGCRALQAPADPRGSGLSRVLKSPLLPLCSCETGGALALSGGRRDTPSSLILEVHLRARGERGRACLPALGLAGGAGHGRARARSMRHPEPQEDSAVGTLRCPTDVGKATQEGVDSFPVPWERISTGWVSGCRAVWGLGAFSVLAAAPANSQKAGRPD